MKRLQKDLLWAEEGSKARAESVTGSANRLHALVPSLLAQCVATTVRDGSRTRDGACDVLPDPGNVQRKHSLIQSFHCWVQKNSCRVPKNSCSVLEKSCSVADESSREISGSSMIRGRVGEAAGQTTGFRKNPAMSAAKPAGFGSNPAGFFQDIAGSARNPAGFALKPAMKGFNPPVFFAKPAGIARVLRDLPVPMRQSRKTLQGFLRTLHVFRKIMQGFTGPQSGFEAAQACSSKHPDGFREALY
jgi:hypothetical protein